MTLVRNGWGYPIFSYLGYDSLILLQEDRKIKVDCLIIVFWEWIQHTIQGAQKTTKYYKQYPAIAARFLRFPESILLPDIS